MKKIRKNKQGFTLVEMVLVLAILVILAAVLVLSVGGYIEKARGAASSLSDHNASISEGTSAIDNQVNINGW